VSEHEREREREKEAKNRIAENNTNQEQFDITSVNII